MWESVKRILGTVWSFVSPWNKNKIGDNYRTLSEVHAALTKAGLESSELIIGIDCTKSNSWPDKARFGAKGLHSLSPDRPNPYEQVISIVYDALVERMDDDQVVPVYGFGDAVTGDRQVFSFNNYQPLVGKEQVLQRYREIIPQIKLAGPTSFAPIIHEAVDLVKETGKYHILVIIADGAVDQMQETIDAIVYASNYSLSIVIIGVGDGPWDKMVEMDDNIPTRPWDNVQFVDFESVMSASRNPEEAKARFAMKALMEVPEQFKIIKELKLLKSQRELARDPPQFRYRSHSSSHSFGNAFFQPPGSNPHAHGPSAPTYPHLNKSSEANAPPSYADSVDYKK